MNCEQVEERLSAYLDNMLASGERRDVTIHLQTCPHCMALLTEMRQYDLLLTQLPRLNPSPVVRERFFSLPEIQELCKANPLWPAVFFSSNQATLPQRPSGRAPEDELTQPLAPSTAQFALERSDTRALPGGEALRRLREMGELEIPPTPPTIQLRPSSATRAYPTRAYQSPRAPRKRWWSPWKVALAVVVGVLLVVSAFSLLGLGLQRQQSSADLSGAITPPAGPALGAVPLAAGSRFIFLRNGTLWSTLVDGNTHQPERLTPANVVVAPGWQVNPIQGNHDAGDLLAYVDEQGGRIHIIRSDGQQDTPIQFALLPAGTTTAWQSSAGQSILASLTWSPDSSMLAFAADPTGSGLTSLSIFSASSGSVRQINANLRGSQAHPVWSPDGTRLAFTLTHDGVVSVFDYALQNRSTLELSNSSAARAISPATVLTLNWFTRAGQSGVTWCLGSTGQITSVWLHFTGADSTPYPQQLASGSYLLALYSAGSNNQTGGWLLVASSAGQAGDLWLLNLAAGSQPVELSHGKQVSYARWSPDGSSLLYLDAVNNGVGQGHLLNIVTGTDQLLPNQVATSPAPIWSADGLQLAYSAGTRINVVHTLNTDQVTYLHLSGQFTSLSWSPATIHQLIISLGAPTPGLYLVNTQQNASHQLDNTGETSLIQWTEIP